jgi:hypothetical protein
MKKHNPSKVVGLSHCIELLTKERDRLLKTSAKKAPKKAPPKRPPPKQKAAAVTNAKNKPGRNDPSHAVSKIATDLRDLVEDKKLPPRSIVAVDDVTANVERLAAEIFPHKDNDIRLRIVAKGVKAKQAAEDTIWRFAEANAHHHSRLGFLRESDTVQVFVTSQFNLLLREKAVRTVYNSLSQNGYLYVVLPEKHTTQDVKWKTFAAASRVGFVNDETWDVRDGVVIRFSKAS